MLVASYLQAFDRASVWYQVDAGDADAASFFHYLQLAAARASPRRRARLPPFTSEYVGGLATFARRTFEQFYGWQRRPFVLVLDNYQLVPEKANLHEIVVNAIEALPEGVRLLVLSRLPPPSRFARLRANGSMTLLSWSSLRLDSTEVLGILQLRHPDAISPAVARELEARADGWAAGLILLLEAGVDNPTADVSLTDGVPESLFDYFASEVLDRQPESVRNTLPPLSLLPKVDEKAAIDLTGDSNAGRVLRRLHRQNFFTQRLGDAPVEYRFHPLFRDFLQARLKRDYSAGALAALLSRAAVVLEASHELEEAVDLYVRAEDWPNAVRAICQQAPTLLARGRGALIDRWMSTLPADVAANEPWLDYWLGCHRMFLDPQAARKIFESTYQRFSSAKQLSGQLLSWCGAVDALLIEWHDCHMLDEWIARGELLLAQPTPFPTDVIEARFLSSFCFALCYRCPQHELAASLIDRVNELIHGSANAEFRALAGGHLMGFLHYMGDTARAESLAAVLERDASDPEVSPAMRFHALRAKFVFHFMNGEPTAGLEAADTAATLCREHGLHAFGETLATTHVLTNLVLGNVAQVRRSARKLLALNPGQFLSAAFLNWILAWCMWFLGDRRESESRAAVAFDNATRSGSPFPIACGHISLATLQLDRGNITEARNHVERARAIAEAMNSATLIYHCSLLAAYIALEQPGGEACLSDLRRAFTFGKERGLYNTYWWDRRRAGRLCALALEHDIEPNYAKEMIRRTRLQPDLGDRALTEWPWPVRIHAFGDFHVESGRARGFSRVGRHRKAMELLRLLVVARSHSLSAATAADRLWPDAEGDSAHGALKTTVHRLRKLLACPESVRFAGKTVSLDSHVCWSDVGAFERLVGTDATKGARAESLLRAIELYTAPLLANEDAEWMLEPREHLRNTFLNAVTELAAYREGQEQWAEAIDLYERAIDVDNVVESFYLGLMHCHDRLGQRAQALEAYERCEDVLCRRFSITPSPKLTALARRLRHH